MDQHTKIILFKDKSIRSHWDANQEEWYFSVVDVVAALTDSANPTDYLKKLRKRDEQLGAYIGTNCPQVAMQSVTGKLRKSLAATTQQLLRIIQSIPSKKAEPFKLWLAEVANLRLEQLQDPELSIDQAMLDYKRLGYSDNWINQRLKSIEIRKELTDEWKKHGLQEGEEFSFLTDVIYKTWAGKTTKEISEVVNPQSFADHEDVAKRGGGVAKEAKLKLEKETGIKVVSNQSAKQLKLTKKDNNHQ